MTLAFESRPASAEPAESGLVLIADNHDAFVVRALMAREARESLDLMYYLWHADNTGEMLTREVIKAADRGVRVRMLLDDMNPVNSDLAHLALDSHPNIELRLFNPSMLRKGSLWRWVELCVNLLALTRRMHNKAWIADGKVALVGGRNVGDAYFDQAETNFRDLDVLLLGKAVEETRAIFDQFWHCDAAKPIAKLNSISPAAARRELRRLAKRRKAVSQSSFQERAHEHENLDALVAANGGACWTKGAKVVSDPPDKVRGRKSESWLLRELLLVLRSARKSLEISSPYFVPGSRGLSVLSELIKDGVETTVLTNSLAATDVAAAHGAYANYRKRLLRRGVHLYELQPFARHNRMSVLGSKGASLHTKSFTVDDRVGFVGSFNFDKRSASLNTEMGVLFEHPTLIAKLREQFHVELEPVTSYRVFLDGRALRWEGDDNGALRRYRSEPDASLFRRALAWVVRWLPIESQL